MRKHAALFVAMCCATVGGIVLQHIPVLGSAIIGVGWIVIYGFKVV